MDSVEKVPHRGFSAKARDVLIGDYNKHVAMQSGSGSGMTGKSSSDFDLRKKLKACNLLGRKDSCNTNDDSPKTPSSSHSIPETQMFDSIGENPKVKKHKQLAQIGKTKSCMEFKNLDKRLIKTFQEENILKMPSIDSDMDNNPGLDPTDLEITDLSSLSRAAAYTPDEGKNSTVKKWLEKSP